MSKKTGKNRNCALCGKEFYVPAWRKAAKFCSMKCYGESKIRMIPWNKGLQVGSVNNGSFDSGAWKWRGSSEGYKSIHYWASKYLGKPTTCVSCGKEATGKAIHWANISGDYRKERNDWIRLCVRCHFQLDKQDERRIKNRR